MQTINGTVGDDYLEYGAPGTGFIIYGYAGNDYINTGGSGDSLFGGAGDDTMWGGTQTNYLDGGDGTDTLFFQTSLDDPGSWSLAMYWRLDLSTPQYNPDYYPPNGMVNTLLNFENIVLINGASDRITGNALDNFLSAHQGNDTLSGLGGNDTVDGGAGDDSLQGGTGADTGSYSGNLVGYAFSLSDGGGELVITDTDPSDGDDGVDVLSGVERAAFADGTINVTLNVRKDLYLDPELNQVPTTVLPLAGGGYMAVWWQGESNLLMQRFDVRGDSLGVPGILAETEGSGSLVTSAALNTGGFVLVWSQSGEVGGGDGSSGVFGRIFDAAGYALGEMFQVNTQTEGNQNWAEVATFPDGSFVVTWDSRSGVHSEGRVFIQRFDAVGQKIGGELLVNLESDGAYLPSVAALADGGCVAVWQAGPGDAPRIFLQRFAADGSRVGTEAIVESADAFVSQSPEVIATPDGGYLVAWQSAGVDPGGYNIYTRRFDASGDALGDQQLINRSFDQNHFEVHLTMLPDGGYVTAYLIQGEGGVRSVYFQRIGPNGEYLGPETRVSDTGDTPLLDVATLEDGGFVITWSSVGADGLLKSYAQEYTADGYRVELYGGDGADHVNWSDAESVALTGGAGDDVLSGGGGADLLRGNGGADTLDGGVGDETLDGGSGDDSLLGGAGDDTYVVDSSSDVVTELVGEGTDTVRSTVDYALGEHLERLEIVGAVGRIATGNALANAVTGGEGDDTLSGAGGDDTLNGGSGTDTASYAGAAAAVTVSLLMAGAQNTVGAGTDTLIEIENLLGSAGRDRLTGNEADNRLDGGAGVDTLAGSLGNDTYVIDVSGETVTELAGAGTDTVISKVSYTLGTNLEALTLTGAGNLNGTGNSTNNLITGNAGNNVLNGSTGTDTLLGGTGDDTYLVNTASDVVTEDMDAGTDTIQSTASYALSANIERLTLTGSSSVSATGNDLDNVLTGNGGNNTLNGGAGSDTMTGGLGNDTYVLDVVTDVATELAGQGTDTLQVYFSHTLGDTFENLTLLGAADLNATGNALTNKLTGNVGNNVLDGAAGVDTLAGGAGNDTYYVETTGEMVTESTNAGVDEVISAVSFTLGSNIERLTLTGAGNLDGTGNTLANAISGTAGNNVLDGGSGNDTLTGGTGDDTYVVGSSADVVIELAGEGTDSVRSSISHTLGSTLEHLTLIGTGSVKGTGNAQSNTITGNQGNNTLDGGAGSDTLDGGIGADVLRGNAGNDTLTGGDGADVFLFDVALASAGVELITDFAVGVDKIRLDDDIFTTFKATVTTLVGADQFVSGAGLTAAQDATDRLVYDTDTGALYYDADGAGGVASVQIAVLGAGTHPGITAGDFVIVA